MHTTTINTQYWTQLELHSAEHFESGSYTLDPEQHEISFVDPAQLSKFAQDHAEWLAV